MIGIMIIQHMEIINIQIFYVIVNKLRLFFGREVAHRKEHCSVPLGYLFLKICCHLGIMHPLDFGAYNRNELFIVFWFIVFFVATCFLGDFHNLFLGFLADFGAVRKSLWNCGNCYVCHFCYFCKCHDRTSENFRYFNQRYICCGQYITIVMRFQGFFTFRKSFVDFAVDNVVFKRYNAIIEISVENCVTQNDTASVCEGLFVTLQPGFTILNLTYRKATLYESDY